MGYAAFLLERGHSVRLWSPSGAQAKRLIAVDSLSVEGARRGGRYRTCSLVICEWDMARLFATAQLLSIAPVVTSTT